MHIMMKNSLSWKVIMLLASGVLVHEHSYAIGLSVKGTLSNTPCIIKPQHQDIVVDFGMVVNKYLAFNSRTHPQVFRLVLSECDGSKNKVSITFKGNESLNQKNKGMLRLKGAQGVYISIENDKGGQLPINLPGKFYDLPLEENSIDFKAFVVAGVNEKITLGQFTGEAVMLLDYSY
ncbi:MAG: fimbrial protein [Enterobacterales bacterium]|uniref:fimbrial protein n=1 Tax=Serratia sp. (in: enterobacteria) TaxID=616 RepID=UPI003F3CB170